MFLCADGGANRLYDAGATDMKPHYIIGDFDSVRPEVLQHYKEMGTITQKFECQDTTDMDKCL